MKFNSDHKVDIDSLNRDEAEAYILFLDIERDRHQEAIVVALAVKRAIKIGGRVKNRAQLDALKELWDSAVLRHQEDIEDITKLIERVKEVKNGMH